MMIYGIINDDESIKSIDIHKWDWGDPKNCGFPWDPPSHQETSKLGIQLISAMESHELEGDFDIKNGINFDIYFDIYFLTNLWT